LANGINGRRGNPPSRNYFELSEGFQAGSLNKSSNDDQREREKKERDRKNFEKEEGIFGFEFEEGFEDDDEVEGDGFGLKLTQSAPDHSRMWKKIGLSPVCPPSPFREEKEDQRLYEKEMSVCEKLVQLAFDQKSHDNISVILVNFGQD